MSSLAFALSVLSLALHYHDGGGAPPPPPLPPPAPAPMVQAPGGGACSCGSTVPLGNELFGADLYPGAGRTIYVEGQAQGLKPAAVLHGDLIVYGDIINASAPPSLTTNADIDMALPSVRSDGYFLESHTAKDWYDNTTQTGRCGWWLGDFLGGAATPIGYTWCQNCTLDEFELERDRCCPGTNLCAASPSNASCARHGLDDNRAACEGSGCAYLDAPEPSVNGTYLTRCVAAFNTDAVWSSRVRRVEATPHLSILASRQRTIYDTRSAPYEHPREFMDQPVYFLDEEGTLELTGAILALSRCSDSLLLRLGDYNPALNPNTVDVSFSDSGAVAGLRVSQRWDEAVPLSVREGNRTAIDASLAGGDTNGFVYGLGDGSASRLGGTPPSVYASARRGAVQNTGLLYDEDGTCYLLMPHSSAPRPGTGRPGVEGCDAYADDIEACFAAATGERDTKHTECEARLYTARARECCVELFHRDVFVECS